MVLGCLCFLSVLQLNMSVLNEYTLHLKQENKENIFTVEGTYNTDKETNILFVVVKERRKTFCRFLLPLALEFTKRKRQADMPK